MKLQTGDRRFRFPQMLCLGLVLGMLASTNVSGATAQCTPGSCDDNNPCTVDTCDPVAGCIYTTTNCDDGNSCTVDSCSPGGAPGVASLFIGHDIQLLEHQYQKIGTFVQAWGALSKATGAAVDANGVVYVCNPSYGNNQIERRGPGNTNLGTIVATVGGQWIEDLGNYGGGYILASTFDGKIFTIDTTTGADVLLFPTGHSLTGVTYDGTFIWTTGGYANTLVYKRDLAGNIIATFNTGQTNTGIGYDPDDGTLWVGHPNALVTHYSQLGVLIGGFVTPTNGRFIDGVELGKLLLPAGCQHNPLDCNDNDFCTVDACDPVTGCSNPPRVCDDTNPCTDDACDSVLGCVISDNTDNCDDSNFCTNGDICYGGLCQAGPPLVCNDNNVCTTDSCDPRFGCDFVNNTNLCDDGNPCTVEEMCAGGTCQPGVPVACDDGNVCTTDTCDPIAGCVYTNNTSPCNDGNGCTTGDVCNGGTCQPGAPLVCVAIDECHVAGICNPLTGLCSNPNAQNGTACNDGNVCTQGDFCEEGTCFGGNPIVCPAPDQCHLPGTCNPDTGACSNPPKPNGTACNDGNPCTVGDKCVGGICAGATTITPPVETQNLSVAADKSTYSWSPVLDATAYAVVRGNMAALPVGSSAGGEVCFAGFSSPAVVDTTTPAPNASFWYLSQARNPCGLGPLGTQSNGTMRVTMICP